jgi:hypothetical protein
MRLQGLIELSTISNGSTLLSVEDPILFPQVLKYFFVIHRLDFFGCLRFNLFVLHKICDKSEKIVFFGQNCDILFFTLFTYP